MSTGQAWWDHKNEEYLQLCKQYGEEPKRSMGARGLWFLDSNGTHAESMREKSREQKFSK